MKSYPKLLLTSTLMFLVLFFNLNCSEKEKVEITKKADSTFSSVSEIDLTDNSNDNATDEQEPSEKLELVFISTFTSGSSVGIYVYKMDTVSGELSFICSSEQTSNPAYLAVHPNKKWVYAVNENSSGTISAFRFDSVQNKLEFINSVSSEGNGPCYISIDNTGKYVLVANYNSGNITVCPINTDGSLSSYTDMNQHSGSGPVAGRQDGPHAHMIIQAPNNFIYNTDLGTDKIMIYNLDTLTGKLSSTGYDEPSDSGAGPRHIEFHPNNKWAYVVCELNGTVEAFNLNNATSEFTWFQTISTLPAGVTAEAASADIHITPDGKYLYASNRAENNNIAMYSINQSSGELSLLGHVSAQGTTPRNFAIDPSGKFLLVACQKSSMINTFSINSNTGFLTYTGIQVSVPNPVCLKFVEFHKKIVTTGIHVINY